jgi:hypothetical protein
MTAARYVTIKKFSEFSGYTKAAIESKIRDRVWPEDFVWKRAPDGRVLIDVEGYEQWVEMGAAPKQPLQAASRSRSNTAARVAANASSSSPRPLT